VEGTSQAHAETRAGEDPYVETGGQFGLFGAFAPSFTADGTSVAFSSTASDIVEGDGNAPVEGGSLTDGSDAFVAHQQQFTPEQVQQSVSPELPLPSTSVPWRLDVTGAGDRGGAAGWAAVPAAGEISASFSARVILRGRARTVGLGSSIVTAPGPGVWRFVVHLSSSATAYAHSGRLSGTLHVLFTPTAGPRLGESLDVTATGVAHRGGARRHGRRRHGGRR
jgi:hypothetical protein